MYESGGEILPLQRSELSEISGSPPMDAAVGLLPSALAPVIVSIFQLFCCADTLRAWGKTRNHGQRTRMAPSVSCYTWSSWTTDLWQEPVARGVHC